MAEFNDLEYVQPHIALARLGYEVHGMVDFAQTFTMREGTDEFTQFEERWDPRLKLLRVGEWRIGLLTRLRPALELVLWLGTYQVTISLTCLLALPLPARRKGDADDSSD